MAFTVICHGAVVSKEAPISEPLEDLPGLQQLHEHCVLWQWGSTLDKLHKPNVSISLPHPGCTLTSQCEYGMILLITLHRSVHHVGGIACAIAAGPCAAV